MKHLTWNKVVGGIIFAITSTCLVITTLMTKQAGVSSAATAEGQQLLGFAAIAIHLGLPAFGIASGIATAKKHKALAWGCIFLVLLCGLYSLRNVGNFVAAERFSISLQREAEAKIKIAREQAAIDAAKQRQEQVAKLVESQLHWNQGTVKQAEGRKDRTDARKDMADANARLIQDFAKTEIAVPTQPIDTTVTVRPDLGNQMLAEFTGWNISALQLSDIVQIILIMLIIEIVGWPTGAQIYAMNPNPVPPPVPLPLPVSAPLPPVPEPKKALPSPFTAATDAKTITVRANPTAEWRELLDKVDFPPAGSRHKGPLRPRHSKDTATLRFLVWLGAYREQGEFHTNTIDTLYEEFATADHREPTATRQIKNVLESIGRRIATKRQESGHGTLWTITPPTIEKMVVLLEKGGVIKPSLPPGLPAPAGASEAEAPQPKRALGVQSLSLWGRRANGGADEKLH